LLNFVSLSDAFVFSRAMGLVYLVLTKPFEDRLHKGSILDLNDDLLRLHTTLTSWSEDGSLPFKSSEDIFTGVPLNLESRMAR
jgi:hypothetical protein